MIKKFLLSLSNQYAIFGFAKWSYTTVCEYIRLLYGKCFAVDEKLVIFESFHGKQYCDSPKAIYEYMKSNPIYSDYRFVWAFQDPGNYTELTDNRTSIVKYGTGAYYKAYSRSKYWIVNGWIPIGIRKKPGQIMIQCWHGTPLKRLRHDIDSSIQTHHRKNDLQTNEKDVSRYDYFISPSRFASKVFNSAFKLEKYNVKTLEVGYPRHDFLYRYKKTDITRIKKTLNIPKNKKTLLYAPTWRDDRRREDGSYEYKSSVDFDFLQKQLSDEFVVLFRGHSIIDDTLDLKKYNNFIIDVSSYDEVNELYIVSDILITDYSSVFFDYAILGRPMIFFMYDLEHYQNDLRGFYIDLKTLPGDIVTTEKQIISILGDLSGYVKKHRKRYSVFNNTYNYIDDDGASERVANIVISRYNK